VARGLRLIVLAVRVSEGDVVINLHLSRAVKVRRFIIG
jgi:hypothetical protein